MEATVARPTAASDVEAVYRAEGDRLWRALYAFSGDEEVASDAVSEAFAQAIRRRAAIRDLRAWVWRAAYRLAAGDLKHRSRLVHGSTPTLLVSDSYGESGLVEALAGLTSQQRIAVVLFYYADLPVLDIAQRTGMNPIAVRAHLSRGRKRLRTLLRDDR